MIKESKYILRRILIGVGIVLVLGFLRSNKVNALEGIDINSQQVDFSTISSDTTYQYIGASNSIVRVYKNRDNTNWAVCSTQLNTCRVFVPSNFLTFTNVGIATDNNTNKQAVLWFTNNCSLPITTENTTSNKFTFQCSTLETKFNQTDNAWAVSSAIGTENEKGRYVNGWRDSYTYYSNVSWVPYLGGSSTLIEFLPSTASTIESLQSLKVNQESYIVAYIFRPKFSNFNIDSYIYQYRVGNNGTWLNFSQNEEQITINNNNTIYFRILDKSNNDVVDSQTYTITDIGTLNTNLNYSIDFSTDYETLESSNIISKYIVSINYLPKSSILTYQYQFVLEGSSLDNNNWNSLSSEIFSYKFETMSNGSLYARILDSDNNVLTTNTFTITEIGKFAINNNSNKNNSFFDKINSSINFGGPISGIINIPINLIRVLSTAIASNTCSDYNLGSLWGTNLVIPCVNIKQHLGNNLYSTIDLICACVMIYYIFKMFGELYTNLLFMQKNPIQDLGKRGD